MGKHALLSIEIVLVCSLFTLSLAEGGSQSGTVAPDGDADSVYEDDSGGNGGFRPEITEDMWKSIVYGRGKYSAENSEIMAPDIPISDCYGEFRVKMKSGYILTREDAVTTITVKNTDEAVYSTALQELDYQFPDMRIELLWGERHRETLKRLKENGEKRMGMELPDLTAWYRVIPDPTLYRLPIIPSSGETASQYIEGDIERLEQARKLLRGLPGVATAHAMAPLIISSTYHPYQYQLAPDHYDGVGGDYDLAPLIAAGAVCDEDDCNIGGLNILPAWDIDGDVEAGIKGANVPIGYVEGAWCIPADGDIEMDTNIPGLVDDDNIPPCSVHPDLTHIRATDNNLRGYRYNGFDAQQHGTAVLGIMAADDDGDGTTGISPESTYYIGQVILTEEWIDVINSLITDVNGNGGIFLLEYPTKCDPSLTSGAPCPAEVWPEIHDFIQTVTANNIVVVNIPGNGLSIFDPAIYPFYRGAGVNLDAPQLYIEDGGDYDFLEAGDVDDPLYDFDYAGIEIEEIQNSTTWPTTLRTLNRASEAFNDSGAIIVTAGSPVDYYPWGGGELLQNRSRDWWNSYGSRIDTHAREGWNYTPLIGYYTADGDYGDVENDDDEVEWLVDYTYNWFPGTSACGPQATGVAALIQQAYKLVRTGDVLTSIRLRNAMVETGNPQILRSEDINRSLELFNGQANGVIPVELESPHEPFARIGPRPDMGRVLQAFNLLPAYDGADAVNSIRISFLDHQYSEIHWGGENNIVSQVYFPNEPYGGNFLDLWYSDLYPNKLTHIRSPRIDGGHAFAINGHYVEDGNYCLYMEDDPNNSEAYLHPTSGIDFTLSAWVLINEDYGYHHGVFTKENLDSWKREWGFDITPDRYLHFSCHSTSSNYIEATNSQALSLNRMHHIAVQAKYVDGLFNQVNFFIDGVAAGTSYILKSYWSACDQVDSLPWIGRGMRGVIDEVQFEDRLVSQTELQSRYEAEANPPGLVSDWRFDRKNETNIYDPVSAYDGTLTTNAVGDFYEEWGPNMPIGSFDGDDYVTIADPANTSYPPTDLRSLGTNFSVEVHFRSPSTANTRNLVTRYGTNYYGNSWKVYWYNGKIHFKVCRSTTSCYTAYSNDLEQGRWYHLVAVYNKYVSSGMYGYYTMKLYIDGEDETSYAPSPAGTAAYDSAQPILIGSISGSSSNRWDSPIDYVRIYNRALETDGTYSGGTWVNTNRDDIKFLFDHRAAIWQNSYYGDYPGNRYGDE